MNKYTRKKKAKHHKLYRYAKTKTKAHPKAHAKAHTKSRDKALPKARTKAKTKKLYYGGVRELTIIPGKPGKSGTLKITELPEILVMPSAIKKAEEKAEQTAIEYWKKGTCGFFSSNELSRLTELIRKHNNILAPIDGVTVVTTDKAMKRSICSILKSIVPKFKQPEFNPGYNSSGLYVCSNPTKYKYDILACATFLLFGIIANKMLKNDCPYKLIFKGGKALQLHGIDHESEDIDVLLIPRRGFGSGSYDESKISELAKNIAYLIKRILNNSSIKNSPIDAQLGEISVLDKEIELLKLSRSKNKCKPITNLSIYKVSWSSDNTGYVALTDIDYKEIDSEARKFYSRFETKKHEINSLKSTVLFEYPTLELILAEKQHYFDYYTSLNNCAQAFIALNFPNFNVTFDQYRNPQDLFNLLGTNPSVEKDKFDIWHKDFSERRPQPLDDFPKPLEHYINQNQHFLNKFQKSITSIEEYYKYKASRPPVELPRVEMPRVEMPQVEMPPVEMPRVEMPPVEMPRVEMPRVEMPRVESNSKKLWSEVAKPGTSGRQYQENYEIKSTPRSGVKSTPRSEVKSTPHSGVKSTPRSGATSSKNPEAKTSSYKNQ